MPHKHAPDEVSRRRGRPRGAARRRLAAVLTMVLGAGMLGTGVASTAMAAGGSSGAGGNFGSSTGNYSLRSAYYDKVVFTDGKRSFAQGTKQASINWFLDTTNLRGTYMGDLAQTECTTAIQRADARSSESNPASRVVALLWAEVNGVHGDRALRSAFAFNDELDDWVDGGYAGFKGLSASNFGDLSAKLGRAAVKEASDDGKQMVSLVCVALNPEESSDAEDPGYDLSVDTVATNTFSLAGTKTAVRDLLMATTDPLGSPTETVEAKVTLYWDKVLGQKAARSVTKTRNITVPGETYSPNFTPADFDWDVWPAGQFWFDVTVAKQGGMNGSFNATNRLASETWIAEYDLDITTDKATTFALAGSTTTVTDTIHASSGGSRQTDKVNGEVVLTWDGIGSVPGVSRPKPVAISPDGDTTSPGFTPADFGWTVWPAGRFWFDVKVPQQGFMRTHVDTPDRDPRETWTASYNLGITTDKAATFTLSGGTGAVNDTIHATTGGSQSTTNLTADIVLTWDGIGGVAGKAVTKPMSIQPDGDTLSPDFTPADFGWTVWPAGNFWFDVKVPKQGLMSAAVDTPDRDPRETWTAQFDLGITTDKAATFTLAGSTGAVTDTIHATSNGSQSTAMVDADVVLVWDGSDAPSKQVTKSVAIRPDGSTTSPAFYPADFGWAAWPAGNFWFDVKVAKQGLMRAAVDTPDRDPRETWKATVPPPTKVLTSGPGRDELGSGEVLASGMFYNAQVTANSAGYTSMAITDTVLTDKVFIGGKDADDVSAVYVLDPAGNRVASAAVTIDRSSSGKVSVTATLTGIPQAFFGGSYTLVVPTYVLPTKADYTIADDSSACYAPTTPALRLCLDGNSRVVRKVTAAPDKVWVLDEDGALVEADPGHTNQEGADEKVFLPGDAVSAVVNGRVPGNLAEPFTQYALTDDWTGAADFVDFSDASKVSVFYETSPGSGSYANVTSQFTVSVSGTRTTATAGPTFLAATKGQSGDRRVKLVISGTFRADYDTDGSVVTLTNAGSERWNNEVVETNTPPVYTWTPDPNKHVLGSSEQDGEHAYDDIDGMAVWPGQKLEYSIGVDLRVPAGTARGVKSLAIVDSYDANFTPDKSSVEIWDDRDANRRRPVPAKNYKLSFDDEARTFTVTFTQAWIDANVNTPDGSANSTWLNQGWLTMRFTGTVNADVPAGSVVTNQAFQVINGVRTATDVPEVVIPTVTPDKEGLTTDEVDLDGKTLLVGDVIVYRLTMDASTSRADSAYYVHKLGMIDDFDEEYLDVDEAGVRVTDTATGADVTGAFNVQIADGVLYVFAKQVDSTNYMGQEVPGDPQPSDLAAYADADIVSGVTPIIDQDLLGTVYQVTFSGKVAKVTDGYVIQNQATQVVENTRYATKVISNPLKAINPAKDVVASADPSDTDGSLSTTEIRLETEFSYRLDSSTIPAGRAYGVKDWTMRDTFSREHDVYLGQWAIYATADLYDGTTLLAEAGDMLQDSTGVAMPSPLGLDVPERPVFFDVAFNEESYTLTVTPTKAYLDVVNSRGDLAAGFAVYTQMKRMAPGERIENVVSEVYNSLERDSNIVWTQTFEHPEIDVEKFTLDEGLVAGDRDTVADALVLESQGINATGEPQETASAAADGPEEPAGPQSPADDSEELQGPAAPVDESVAVGITVTNTGDVNLVGVSMRDETVKDTFGELVDIVQVDDDGEALQGAGLDPEDFDLEVGQSVHWVGYLRELAPGALHGDQVTVKGRSAYSDAEVSDVDAWYVRTSDAPAIDVEKFTLSEGLVAGDRDTAEEAFAIPMLEDGVQVGITVTNTGNTPLTDVSLVDERIADTFGDVTGFVCQAPAVDGVAPATSSLTEPIARLDVGASVTCVGILEGLEHDQLHGDIVTVTAKALHTGTEVTDSDAWYAKAPVAPAPDPEPEPEPTPDPEPEPRPDPPTDDPKIVVAGVPITAGINAWLVGSGLGLMTSGIASAVWLYVRRRREDEEVGAGQ